MCGIYGFTGSKDQSLLKKMGSTLYHRGPDNTSVYETNGFSLGITRLSIVDIEGGYQPWKNIASKVSVVCNGEIYNYRELRELLLRKGYRLKSDHSDTEILPYLYLEYGLEFINKIDGMFAIALYDSEKDTLFLIRDRVGKKPLYYREEKGVLYFASEIKALLCVGNKPDINQNALSEYFSHKNSVAPETIYKDIYQLEPAMYLEYKDKGILQKKKYWNLSFTGENTSASRADIESELMGLLEQSVKKRIDIDVEYGVFLSGGLDSSLISAIAQEYSPNRLKSFTLSYNDDIAGKNNDTEYAEHFSKTLGTQHYNLVLDKDEVFSNLESVLRSFDEPFSGTISTYFLSKYISEHVKVALSGDGSDEIFGSYLTHRLSSMLDNSDNMDIYKDSADYQKMIEMNIQKNTNWRDSFSVFSYEEQMQLLLQPVKKQVPCLDILNQTHLHQTLESEFSGQLPNQILAFSDRLSMAHSLEIRSPFLDTKFIEFVARIPSKYKIEGKEVKSILKAASLKYLPRDLAYRKKEGFVLPVYNWIEAQYYSHVKSYVLDSNIYADVNRKYVELLFSKFEKHKNNHVQVWSLYNYAIWKEGIFNGLK